MLGAYRITLILIAFAIICGAVIACLSLGVQPSRSDNNPQSAVPSLDNIDDIVVKRWPNRTLMTDIAMPSGLAAKARLPLIVCIHGGGWAAGDRKHMREQINALARFGFVAASVEYRLVSQAKYPAQLEDVVEDVRFLVANADKYHIDKDQIVLFGGSAGGHLALMLATMDKRRDQDFLHHFKACASLAGPTDLDKKFPSRSQAMIDALFAPGTAQDSAKMHAACKQASPVTYVDANDTPILMIHGTVDELVPYDQATEMLDRCNKAGLPAQLYTIKDGGHGSGGAKADWDKAIYDTIMYFKSKTKT